MAKTNPRVLALDVATKTGWAIGNTSDNRPVSSTQRIAPPGSSAGFLFLNFAKWLTDLMKVDRPDIVFFEAPLDPRWVKSGRTNMQTVRRLMTMAGLVEMVCEGRGIYDVREADVPDVRHHFLGTRSMKGERAKRMTLNKCHTLGWEPVDDNAADALALWSYGVSTIKGNSIVSASYEQLF